MAMIFDFRSIAMQWSSIGIFDILLPMLLIFTVVYAVLQRTKILTGKREIDAIVALVIGFFVMGNPEVSQFFLPLFSNAALGIVILVVFLLLVGLVMPKAEEGQWNTITLVGGIAIFLWVMSRAADYFGGNMIFSSFWWADNSGWVIPLILVIIVLAIVFSSEKQAPQYKAWQELYGHK